MAIATIKRPVREKSPDKSVFESIKKLNLNINLSQKTSKKEIIFFTSQLSLMVEIGAPLNVSLSSIAKQLKNPEFIQAMTGIVANVEEGKLLSAAISKYPDIFSDLYISLVRAGENTGQLKEMLDRIIEIHEKQEKFVGMIKRALTYPAILCFMSVGVVIFMLTFVFPKFSVLFKEIHDILPVSTKFLLWLSDFMSSYWHATAILTGVLAWGIYAYAKSDKGKLIIHSLKIRIPILANIFVRVYLVQMMRTLGFLMGSNIPLMEALMVARGGTSNLVFAKFIDKISMYLEEGRGMSPAFNEASFIPENAKQIVKTGEETQNLAKVMLRLSDHYEGEIDDHLKQFTAIIEPVLLIVMGVVVGVIVISLILPIFKLSRMTH